MDQFKFAIALAICFFLSSVSYAQELNWQSDVDLAKNLAAKESKNVLLHFTAEWCRPCKQLKTFVFPSPTVVAAIQERCVPVMVDTDQNPELVKQYEVDSIPLDIVITPAGRVLQKRQSPKDSTNFVRMMKAIDNVDTQYAKRNAVISQKIGDVLQEIENGAKSKVSSDNDFAVKAPEHVIPEPGKDGKLLLSKSKTRLVDHVSETVSDQASFPTTSKPAVKDPSPQRVFNDRFFVEKSHVASESEAKIRNGQQAVLSDNPSLHADTRLSANNLVATAATTPNATQESGTNNVREPMAIPSGGAFVPVERKQANGKSGPPSNQAKISVTHSPRKSSTADQKLRPTTAKLQTPAATSSLRSPNESKAVVVNDKNSVSVPTIPAKIEVDAVKRDLAKNATSNPSTKVEFLESKPASARIVGLGEKQNPTTNPAQQNNFLRNTLLNREGETPRLDPNRKLAHLRSAQPSKVKSASKPITLKKPAPMGLGGKCPVSLVQEGKWVLGDKKYGCVHRGKTYLFSDAKKLSIFQNAPEKYSPILAGYDPVAFHNDGELVEGKEKHGVFMGTAPDHRIVLFQTQESRAEFQKNPQKFMSTVRLAIKQSDEIR